jgi:hypothetical protein
LVCCANKHLATLYVAQRSVTTRGFFSHDLVRKQTMSEKVSRESGSCRLAETKPSQGKICFSAVHRTKNAK